MQPCRKDTIQATFWGEDEQDSETAGLEDESLEALAWM
jgi:hypothetical protein